MEPVSKLKRRYPRRFASAMICRTTARATPLRRCAEAVRIDLISPCRGSSSFSAPQPRSSPFSQTLQKVMSGLRKPSIGSACTLSGGECTNMLARCSFNSSAISGRLRSSSSMCTNQYSCRSFASSTVNSRTLPGFFLVAAVAGRGNSTRNFLNGDLYLSHCHPDE